MVPGVREDPSSLAGRYLLGAELGRGGMAVVYRAWDTLLNRDVAVKLMRDVVITDAASRARFDAERRTLARLSHPALTAIFDAGTHDDRPYLVMELVRGETLTERYQRTALGVAEVARIGIPLADALSYVHARGIVHRDIKPSNILLGSDGAVRLADFGIARLLTEATRVTATGMTMGTAAYLAPEQVRGASAETAGDVYALGLVLLEALSRAPVFTGPPDVAALARLIAPPEIDPGLPAGLRTLLRAMTADRPDQRPTAVEVGTGLRQVLADAGAASVAPTSPNRTSPRPTDPVPTTPEPTSRWSSHRLSPRSLRWAPAGLAAALVLGGILLLASPFGASSERADRPSGGPSSAPSVSGPTSSSPSSPAAIGATPVAVMSSGTSPATARLHPAGPAPAAAPGRQVTKIGPVGSKKKDKTKKVPPGQAKKPGPAAGRP